MKRTVSFVLMSVMIAAAPSGLEAQTQAPARPEPPRPATGVISGSATFSAGSEAKDGTRIHLVDAASGRVVAKTETKDGDFSLTGVAAGSYTLQCVEDNGRVFGTASVTLALPSAQKDIVCGSEALAFWKKKGVLAALGAAAAAIGGAAIVAATGDASGSR